MSARYFKILGGVLIAHVIVLSTVWVGFSAPYPRPPATFVYCGALPSGDTGGQPQAVWSTGQGAGQLPLDHFKASYFNHWIELRGPSKSYNDDHLGF